MVSEDDVSRAPATRFFRNSIDANATMKIKQEVFVDRAAIEFAYRNRTFRGSGLRESEPAPPVGESASALIACFQSMRGIVVLCRRAFSPFFLRRRSADASQEFRDSAQHVVCRVFWYRIRAVYVRSIFFKPSTSGLWSSMWSSPTL